MKRSHEDEKVKIFKAEELDVSTLGYAEAFVLYKKVKEHIKSLEWKQEQEEERSRFHQALITLPKVYDEMMRLAKLQDPQKFHKMIAQIEEYKEEGPFEDPIVSEFFSVPSLFKKAIRQFPNVYLCSKNVKTSDLKVPCINDDCWYENNKDRIEKVTTVFYCPLLPRVLICDVCLDNHDNFWGEMFEDLSLELNDLDKYVEEKFK